MAKPVALSLRPGDPAPSFSATITNGTEIHSKDLLGKPVVIYFYPRDDTPGCTKEACGFRDQYPELQKTGAVVLGVSADTVKSHAKFTDKFQLPFPLSSDTDAVTFLIGADGRIARVWDLVKPESHAAEVLEALKSL